VIEWKGGGRTYAWTGPNSFSSTLQNPSVASATTVANGTYQVIVTNFAGCTANATTSVTVNPVVVIPTPQANTQIPLGGSVTLTATGCSGVNDVLKWYQSTDNALVSMPVSPTTTKNYYAKCERTLNGIKCISEKSTDVTVVTITTATLVISVITGPWEANSTWDIGRVPQLGDYVIIDNGHIVTLNTTGIAKNLTYRGTGQLKFNSTTSKLELGF
jgi:hypothetical protein